ncbi:MAG TPA: hypothetical protein VFU10_06330 [Gaiellaceae bacterium]|nr:hypothetical protein [Gaiellaceae bacterium]
MKDRLETFATILLAVAAVTTAWATYQSAQWRGQQAINTSKATAARIQSSEAATRAGQEAQVDLALFTQWLDAYAGGDEKLAAFYRERFRPEFTPAFDAWLALHPKTNPRAPKSPFAMPQYHPASLAQSAALDAQATARSAASEQANKRSNNYVLAVVLLASALFFAGVSTKLRTERHQEVLLALGWLIYLGTVVWLLSSPVRV